MPASRFAFAPLSASSIYFRPINLNEATLVKWGIGYYESEINLRGKGIKFICPDTFKNYYRVFALDLTK